MDILTKYKFDKEESKKCKGICLPANSFHSFRFDKEAEYVVSGDEYLVKKFIELAKSSDCKAKQGKVEKQEDKKEEK